MRIFPLTGGILLLGLAALSVGSGPLPSDKKASSKALDEQIEHGRYLVNAGGCDHCHSPKVMSPHGPVPHPMKVLSGQQADAKLPSVPQGVLGPDKWAALTNNDMTAWAGPWGVSFAANLTPDMATGIGGWTEEMFVQTLRTGKHLGTGRAILPPMPWESIGKMTDQDLKDMFAYFKSLTPVRNAVPQPMPPAGGGK
jgi:hypothetical protein